MRSRFGTTCFNFAIKVVPSLVSDILEKNQTTLEEIDHVICHQANKYMLGYLRKKMNIPEEKFYINLLQTGNTVSPTIPIAIKDCLDEGIIKPGDDILMEHNEDRNQLVFQVGNITRRMSLVDTTGISDPKVPNLTLPVVVSVRTEELRQGIRASESVSDHIALTATSDGFEMASEGDTDSVDLKLPKDLLEELECKEEVRSLFPLDYFSNMIKAISTSTVVTMRMGNDYPVKMEFSIAGGKGEVTYLLAPRIESE